MSTYVRPHDCDPVELCNYLLAAGVTSSVSVMDDGLHIETDVPADELMANFVPTSTDGNYVAPVPSTAAVASHLQHLKDFRNTVRQGGPAPSLAQTQHVIADVIDALRLLDARLEREA